MKKLRSLFSKLPNSEMFTLADASRAGVTKYYLEKMIDEGYILEIKKGVFQNRELSLIDENIQETVFKAITAKLKEKSAICLWSALSYYGLTDEIPEKVWCIIPYPYNVTFIKPIRLKKPNWNIGINHHDGFAITSIERTIVDCFTNNRYVPVSEAFSVLKMVLKNKKTNVKKLLLTAEELGAKEKILLFLEIAI